MMRTVTRPLSGLLLAASLAAAGCAKDANKPEAVDPQAVSAGVADLASAFTGNLPFQSLRYLSSSFGFAAASRVAAVAALLPPALGTPRAEPTPAQRAALLALALQGANAPQAIFPSDVLGKTLVWDTTLGRYAVDPNATGAPSNGVRFVLYLVGDTILGTPRLPLVVTGHVDLKDESDARANRLRVVVQYLAQTVADYTITAAYSTTSLALESKGYLTDGTARLDFDLVLAAGLSGLDITYTLSGSNGFDAVLRITIALDTGATAMLWRISDGSNSVEVELSQADSLARGAIRFNGATVAGIVGTIDAPVITGTGRVALAEEDLLALRAIFANFVSLVDQLTGVFGPAQFLLVG